MASVISVRVNEREAELFRRAAFLHGCGVSSLLKKLALEKLEDDYDWQIIKEYEQSKRDGTLELIPANEFFEELGL